MTNKITKYLVHSIHHLHHWVGRSLWQGTHLYKPYRCLDRRYCKLKVLIASWNLSYLELDRCLDRRYCKLKRIIPGIKVSHSIYSSSCKHRCKLIHNFSSSWVSDCYLIHELHSLNKLESPILHEHNEPLTQGMFDGSKIPILIFSFTSSKSWWIITQGMGTGLKFHGIWGIVNLTMGSTIYGSTHPISSG